MSRESKATKDEIQRSRNEAYQGGWDDGYAEGFGKAVAEYILASEADAMVAAALRDLAQRVALQMEVLSAILQPWPLRTAGKVDAILALIPQPASAALDKLIAEAVKAERDRVTRIAASLFPGGYDNNRIKIEDQLSEIAANGATP